MSHRQFLKTSYIAVLSDSTMRDFEDDFFFFFFESPAAADDDGGGDESRNILYGSELPLSYLISREPPRVPVLLLLLELPPLPVRETRG